MTSRSARSTRALPEGETWESFGAGLLVVRLPPKFNELPPSRRGWAPQGIMAFSKICPHAGARSRCIGIRPIAQTSTPAPAFTCPCHYSTFTPGDGGKVIFGPAGRALPQLPLMVDADGNLRAAGRFDAGHRPVVVGGTPDVKFIQRAVHRRFERAARYTEQRLGGAPAYKWLLRYVFPDHWTFLLGEIALYAFLILVATGIFLTLYYIPSDTQVIYHGSYALLRTQEMSEAYRSVLDLSFNVPAGLLIRQVHHWAADVFIAAIVLHLMRIFFTGAYRKPRDLNYYIGLTMLMLAILEGFAGYSLVDDLLSGMGLAIANGVALSIPLVGGQLASLDLGWSVPGHRTASSAGWRSSMCCSSPPPWRSSSPATWR